MFMCISIHTVSTYLHIYISTYLYLYLYTRTCLSLNLKPCSNLRPWAIWAPARQRRRCRRAWRWVGPKP